MATITNSANSSTTTLSQVFCFPSIIRHKRHSISFPPHAGSPKVSTLMSVGGGGDGALISQKTKCQDNNGHVSKQQESQVEQKENGVSDPLKNYGSAKIHDFCFGIPYGGIVLSGGVVVFIFSRNPTALGTGVLFGGALLALSSFSLKVWRKGFSSLPFVLGQAVLSGLLFWKSFQAYSLTKKLVPSGIFAVISAAMLCFYSYVMISGGNPPPKKLQASATVSA